MSEYPVRRASRVPGANAIRFNHREDVRKRMVLNESKAEKILGVVFTVLGVLLLAVIIPTQIAYVKMPTPSPGSSPISSRD